MTMKQFQFLRGSNDIVASNATAHRYVFIARLKEIYFKSARMKIVILPSELFIFRRRRIRFNKRTGEKKERDRTGGRKRDGAKEG